MRLLVLPFLIVTAIPAAAQAPGIAPPSDSVTRLLLTAFQDPDPVARGATLSGVLSARARTNDSLHIDRFIANLHRAGAPFTVLGTRKSGRSSFVQLTSPRTRRTLTLQFSTDRYDPSGVGVVDVLVVTPTVLDELKWSSAAGLSPAEVAAVIDQNIARATEAGAFSGVVYVMAGDSVVLAKGYGLADREHAVPNTVDTRFAMASIGKMFTAVAILRLVDQGKLRLTDTLARVLPAYPNAERAGKITVSQLLAHTSGMGDQWSTPKKPVPGLTGALGTAAAVAHAPLLFEPGERWSYSNEGYTVLAAIIEQLTGTSYTAYVQREILDRAGMTGTVITGTGADQIVPRRAIGYRPAEDDALGVGELRANWSFIAGSASAGGAGGGYTTAADLAKFGTALRAGTLLSHAMRDSMWTGRWDIPGYPGERYGYGSFVRRIGDRAIVGHGGGGTGSGMDNGFRHFTDGSWTVVVLSNMDPPAATRFQSEIVTMLGGKD